MLSVCWFIHFHWWACCITSHIDGLVQDCSNSTALAMELQQAYSKPSILPRNTLLPSDATHCQTFWQRVSKSNPTIDIPVDAMATNPPVDRCLFARWIGIIVCTIIRKQGQYERFDSCDRPGNLTQIGFKSTIFSPCDIEIWLMTSKNFRVPLLHYIKLRASFQIYRWIQIGSKRLNSGQNRRFFVPCDLEIW